MSISKSKNLKFILVLVIFLSTFSLFLSQPKAQSVDPYWIEYVEFSTNIHKISPSFTTEGACHAWWTQNEYTLGTLFKDCFSSPTTPKITPQTSIGETDTTYSLLAPLPGIEEPIDTKKSDTNPCPLGKYLNIIIKLCFGIAGVLAVVMIVWGGVQYMTTELVSSKEEGKKSIRNAIFGLLLALSSYLILNTINPDLLNICLNNIKPVELVIMDEIETPTTALLLSSGTPPSGSTVGCKEGIQTITTNYGGTFYICKPYAEKIKNMINAAWSSSPAIRLSGGSFRSKSKQEKLREINCGGQSNIYNVSAKCNPLTAVPGTSRHENGLAIDFTCSNGSNAKLINLSESPETSICFNWLKLNAGKPEYGGFQNLPQENWHWSTDGH